MGTTSSERGGSKNAGGNAYMYVKTTCGEKCHIAYFGSDRRNIFYVSFSNICRAQRISRRKYTDCTTKIWHGWKVEPTMQDIGSTRCSRKIT